MRHLKLNSLIFLFILFVFTGMTGASAQQSGSEQDKDVVILFDSSASMLVEIDGTPKLDLARSAVGDLLDSLPVRQQISLVTFGHGASTQCGNIETLVPMGQNQDQIKQTLSQIKPRGFTPLSSAIEQVAAEYEGSQRSIDVILFSDGGDQCFRDPCELAKKLEAANAQFTAHVVATGEGDEVKIPQLKCIAEATGGRFLRPDEVTQFAETTNNPPPATTTDTPPPPVTDNSPPPITTAPPPVSDDASEPEVEEEEVSMARLRLVATDMESGRRLQEDVRWQIVRSDTGEIVYLGEGSGNGITVDIPPGTFDFIVLTANGDRGELKRLTLQPGVVRGVIVPVVRRPVIAPPATDTPPITTPPPVVERTPPEIQEQTMISLRLIATDLKSGKPIEETVTWRVIRSGTRDIVYTGKGSGNGLTAEVPEGVFDFYVATQNNDRGVLRSISVNSRSTQSVTVPVQRKPVTPPPATDRTPPISTAPPPQVLERIPPEIQELVTVSLRLIATDRESGKPIEETVSWRIIRSGTRDVIYTGNGSGNGLTAKIPYGVYDFYVETRNGDRGVLQKVTVNSRSTRSVTVPVQRKPVFTPPVTNAPPITTAPPTVIERAPPEIQELVTISLRLIATDRESGKPIAGTVSWILVKSGTRDIVFNGKGPGAGLTVKIPPGIYDLRVETPNGDRGALQKVSVNARSARSVIVPVQRKAVTSPPPTTDRTPPISTVPPITSVPPQVLERIPPEIQELVTMNLRLIATDRESGKPIEGTVSWIVIRSGTRDIVFNDEGPGAGLTIKIPPGVYDFSVQTQNGDHGALQKVSIKPRSTRSVTVPVQRKARESIRG